MIVRISHEGQYELADGSVATLNELDSQAVDAGEAGDEGRFHAAYGRLLDFVRENGRPVDADHLGGSDIILPPHDVTLAETSEEFTAEGLLPG